MATRAIDSDETWGGAGPKGAPSKRRGLWIGLGIGAAALLCLTCIGSLIGLMFLWFNMVTTQLEDELRPNAELQAEIGELQEVETDWSRSLSDADDDVFVYRVTGSKGSVLVRIRSDGAGDRENILWAEMELPSGERRVLVEATPDPREE